MTMFFEVLFRGGEKWQLLINPMVIMDIAKMNPKLNFVGNISIALWLKGSLLMFVIT
jgi:hypothetical protein